MNTVRSFNGPQPMKNERIQIRQSLELNPSGEHSLSGDLYLPAQDSVDTRPAVVLVYGGGWRTGDRSQQKVYGLALAKAGFVCLATDYRWSTEARWPAQLNDVKTAIRWLRAHAEDLNVDHERIAISGNSSGGHLALMAAAVPDDSTATSSAPGEYQEFSSEVSAVCAFYPPTRLFSLDEESVDDTVSSLLGADASIDDLERASPLGYASQAFPPTLLLCGSDDLRVPVEHTCQMHEALKNAGNTAELHLFAGLGHAFDADREHALLSAAIMVHFFQRYI